MKFLKDVTGKGLQLPLASMKLCGFEDGEKAEFHTSESVLVVLKQRMTAMELIRAARQLHELSVELTTHLAKVCGPCDGCGGDCPFGDWKDGGIDLPADLRAEAGIPQDAKLCAYVDEDEGTVTIAEADFDYDLRDVPPEIMEMLTSAKVCIGELEERLILEDIVYGR